MRDHDREPDAEQNDYYTRQVTLNELSGGPIYCKVAARLARASRTDLSSAPVPCVSMSAHDDFHFHGLLRAFAEQCHAIMLVKDLGGHSVSTNRSFQQTADLNRHTRGGLDCCARGSRPSASSAARVHVSDRCRVRDRWRPA